jgi:hypothetical protein
MFLLLLLLKEDKTDLLKLPRNEMFIAKKLDERNKNKNIFKSSYTI